MLAHPHTIAPCNGKEALQASVTEDATGQKPQSLRQRGALDTSRVAPSASVGGTGASKPWILESESLLHLEKAPKRVAGVLLPAKHSICFRAQLL